MKKNKRTLLLFILLFSSLLCQAGVNISVNAKLKKERDTSKKGKGYSVKRTKKELQKYQLEITISNIGKENAQCVLEWYFFKQKFQKKSGRNPTLCEKGSLNLSLSKWERVKKSITSITLSNSVTKSSSKTGSRRRRRSIEKKTYSGFRYKGYVVLLRQQDKIIAKKTSDTRFLKPEWMEKIEAYKK